MKPAGWFAETVRAGIDRVRRGEISADDLVLSELPAVWREAQDGFDPTAHRLYVLWRQCEDGGDFDGAEFVRRADAILQGRDS